MNRTTSGHDAHKGCAPHWQGRREARGGGPLHRQAGRCSGAAPSQRLADLNWKSSPTVSLWGRRRWIPPAACAGVASVNA